MDEVLAGVGVRHGLLWLPALLQAKRMLSTHNNVGEDMEERVMTDSAVAARFYDALRSSGLSAAALAHGEAYIGQECLLTPDEIADLARWAGITAETSVLDIGSGTGDRRAIWPSSSAVTSSVSIFLLWAMSRP